MIDSSIAGGGMVIVTIQCLVFNHAPYLRQCLDGIVMQKTNFRFEAIVHDDASTDGSASIISEYAEEYPDIIKPIFETENQYTKGSDVLQGIMNANTHGRYVAICEGDDYWIDPLKLQKQVDFLSSHTDYSLIGSNGVVLYTDPNKGLEYFNNHHNLREVTFEELVNIWVFPTASLLFRKDILNNYPKWSKDLHFGDDIIVMTCAIHGKVATLGELSCVYRKGSGITKELDKKQEFMAEQHKLFYTHLLEDTGDKYRDVLLARIKQDEKDRLYWHTKGKSNILVAIRYPRRTFKFLVRKMIRQVKPVIRICLKLI